jgi:flagellar basal-body rod protein FlgC
MAMSIWNIMRIGASALGAQRMRLELISNNIANAETTHTADGTPYKRQDLILTPQGTSPFEVQLARLRGGDAALTTGLKGVQVASIVTDNEEGPRVYDPSHPDADEDGFVQYPNVNMVVEMTNMISASRSYEAGLTVIEAAKRMALKALEIGK